MDSHCCAYRIRSGFRSVAWVTVAILSIGLACETCVIVIGFLASTASPLRQGPSTGIPGIFFDRDSKVTWLQCDAPLGDQWLVDPRGLRHA